MKKYIAIMTMMGAIVLSASVPVRWNADVTQTRIQNITAYHGETLDLECTIKEYGENIFHLMTAKLYWQTNGMNNVWWHTNATFNAGVVSGKFTPQMDPGVKDIRFFFALEDGSGLNYRANGIIRYIGESPGFAPTTLEVKNLQTINFSEIEIINAPWITPKDLEPIVIDQNQAISNLNKKIESINLPTNTLATKSDLEHYLNKTNNVFSDFLYLHFPDDQTRLSVIGDIDAYNMYIGGALYMGAELDNRFGHTYLSEDTYINDQKFGDWLDRKTNHADVTNIVNDVLGTVHDEKTEIIWKQVMYDGNLYYIATTNKTEVTE